MHHKTKPSSFFFGLFSEYVFFHGKFNVFSFVKLFVLLSGWYLVSWHHCHWAGQGWTPELRHAPHESALPHPQEHTTHPQRRLLQDFQRVCGLLSQQRPYVCKHTSSIAFSCCADTSVVTNLSVYEDRNASVWTYSYAASHNQELCVSWILSILIKQYLFLL